MRVNVTLLDRELATLIEDARAGGKTQLDGFSLDSRPSGYAITMRSSGGGRNDIRTGMTSRECLEFILGMRVTLFY